MRLDIRYLTRFDYEGPVWESQNELRACPASDDHQQLVHYDVTTQPSSRHASYVDSWGTRVDTFGIRAPHDRLEVIASATVETVVRDEQPAPVPLAAVAAERFRDDHLEFLQRSPHVDWQDVVVAAARGCRRAGGDELLAVVHAVHDHVADLDYRTGETYVGVPVDRIHSSGGGVCQDFAHLAIAMYRELGIPARYASGYLFTTSDATGEDTSDDEVQVETHAWVEVAIPGWGWFALDPTNRQAVGDRHVTIGRGRDYDDVAPFRGVFSGAQGHHLTVSVTMRRLALEPLGVVAPGRPPRQVAPDPIGDAGQRAQQQQ